MNFKSGSTTLPAGDFSPPTALSNLALSAGIFSLLAGTAFLLSSALVVSGLGDSSSVSLNLGSLQWLTQIQLGLDRVEIPQQEVAGPPDFYGPMPAPTAAPVAAKKVEVIAAHAKAHHRHWASRKVPHRLAQVSSHHATPIAQAAPTTLPSDEPLRLTSAQALPVSAPAPSLNEEGSSELRKMQGMHELLMTHFFAALNSHSPVTTQVAALSSPPVTAQLKRPVKAHRALSYHHRRKPVHSKITTVAQVQALEVQGPMPLAAEANPRVSLAEKAASTVDLNTQSQAAMEAPVPSENTVASNALAGAKTTEPAVRVFPSATETPTTALEGWVSANRDELREKLGYVAQAAVPTEPDAQGDPSAVTTQPGAAQAISSQSSDEYSGGAGYSTDAAPPEALAAQAIVPSATANMTAVVPGAVTQPTAPAHINEAAQIPTAQPAPLELAQNETSHSEVRAISRPKYVEAFDAQAPVSDIEGQDYTTEFSASGEPRGWEIVQAPNHWPTLARKTQGTVPLASTNTIALMSRLLQSDIFVDTGIVYGELASGVRLDVDPQQGKALFLNAKGLPVSEHEIEDRRTFALINVAPGPVTLHLTLPLAGNVPALVTAPVLKNTLTYLDLSAPTRRQLTGKLVDASSPDLRGVPASQLRVSGLPEISALATGSGRFVLGPIYTFGDHPVGVEAFSSGTRLHRYQLRPEEIGDRPANLFVFAEAQLQEWLGQLEGGLTNQASIFVGAVPSVLSAAKATNGKSAAEAGTFASTRMLFSQSNTVPETYSIEASGQLSEREPLDRTLPRFLSVQVPSGMALTQIGENPASVGSTADKTKADAAPKVYWSELTYAQPGAVEVIGPY